MHFFPHFLVLPPFPLTSHLTHSPINSIIISPSIHIKSDLKAQLVSFSGWQTEKGRERERDSQIRSQLAPIKPQTTAGRIAIARFTIECRRDASMEILNQLKQLLLQSQLLSLQRCVCVMKSKY